MDKLIAKLNAAIEELIKRIIANAIKGCLDFIGDIFGYGFTDIGDSSVTPGALISAKPDEWLNGSVWNTMKSISESAIMPIAAIILCFVLVNELVQMLVSGNQFEQKPASEFLMWGTKAIIGAYLTSNIFNIINLIFSFGIYAGKKGLEVIGNNQIQLNLSNIDFTIYEIPKLIVCLILAIITVLAVGFFVIAVIISLAGRIIECYMYMAIAPIPMATMMSNEWKGIGQNWLKAFTALAFQGVFVVITIGIASGLLNNVVLEFTKSNGEPVLPMILLLGFTITLAMTVLRSGQISKSVFAAS